MEHVGSSNKPVADGSRSVLLNVANEEHFDKAGPMYRDTPWLGIDRFLFSSVGSPISKSSGMMMMNDFVSNMLIFLMCTTCSFPARWH